MNKLVIATPVRAANIWSASISVGYAESVRKVTRELPAETVSAVVTFACDVVRARNRIVNTVLREFPDATHVLWWDDDEWPENPEDGLKVIKEMMDSGEDLLGAPYTNKRQPLRWVHQLLQPCPTAVGGLQEVKGLGFGFTMTTTKMLRVMTERTRKYTDWPNTHKVANLFGQVYDKVINTDDPEAEALLSEDFSFCKRWREMGGKVKLYLNSGIILHTGGHAWSAREMVGGIIQ